jgi:hypothetical protein
MGSALKGGDLLGDSLASVTRHDPQAAELGQADQLVANLRRQLSGRD